MIERVLLCNAGSSSLKVQISDLSGARIEAHEFAGDPAALVAGFREWLGLQSDLTVALHRVVHAGAVTEQAVKLDEKLCERIRHWSPLAPLHNSLALAVVAVIAQQWPVCEQLAVFDSGLYADLPALSRAYALPPDISQRWPVQRYGFHGLAHRAQFRLLQNQGTFDRVITLQLGGGTSATAWSKGKAVDTTMGFSPLEGLPMGSRSGSVDPGILLHLLQNENYAAESLQDLLNNRSGLMGLSGESSDMRDLLASASAAAKFAVDYYCYQLRKIIGSFVAILGGIDAVTLGGGIGEHQAVIRHKIFAGMSHLSLSLDEAKNSQAHGACSLHTADSGAAIWLAPVDEAAEMLLQYAQFKRLHRL